MTQGFTCNCPEHRVKVLNKRIKTIEDLSSENARLREALESIKTATAGNFELSWYYATAKKALDVKDA